jgi:hypothetical protein
LEWLSIKWSIIKWGDVQTKAIYHTSPLSPPSRNNTNFHIFLKHCTMNTFTAINNIKKKYNFHIRTLQITHFQSIQYMNKANKQKKKIIKNTEQKQIPLISNQTWHFVNIHWICWSNCIKWHTTFNISISNGAKYPKWKISFYTSFCSVEQSLKV